jgi:hypothetical protein
MPEHDPEKPATAFQDDHARNAISKVERRGYDNNVSTASVKA